MGVTRSCRVGVAASALACALFVTHASAVERYGPLQISGSLETQNLLRHPDIDQWTLVQQRNTLRLRFDLDLVKQSKGTLGFDLPGVRDATLFLLLRPDYESVYDIQPGRRADVFPYGKGQKDGSLNAFGDAPDSVRNSNRIADANVNAFREAYLDLELEQLPVSFRIGRQQVVWGETDSFRMLDRVNPLDLTWHLQQEPWVDLRKTLTMLKTIVKTGDVGPIHESFLEVYWGLGDWVPAEQKFLPYPWSVPLEDPLVNAATCTDPNNKLTCKDFQLVRGVLFRRGDYDKNPIDNGQVGARFVFNPLEGLNMSLAYFYQRFNFDDGAPAAAIRAVDQAGPTPSVATNNLLSIGNGVLPAEARYPYVHTVGGSATWDDAEHTGTVYRIETIYDFDLPFSDTTKSQVITNPGCVGAESPVPCDVAPELPSGLHFVSKSSMWKGMLGFDRDTPIPALNKRKTISFTGQFFWHYMVSSPDTFVGGLGASDRVRRWEVLSTIAAYTDYFTRFGIDNPLLYVAIDWANHYNMEVGWKNTLFITNNLHFTLFQNYFFTPGFGGEVAEPWGIGGINKKRDETGIKLTRQF